jgi:hypothetical protein
VVLSRTGPLPTRGFFFLFFHQGPGPAPASSSASGTYGSHVICTKKRINGVFASRYWTIEHFSRSEDFVFSCKISTDYWQLIREW